MRAGGEERRGSMDGQMSEREERRGVSQREVWGRDRERLQGPRLGGEHWPAVAQAGELALGTAVGEPWPQGAAEQGEGTQPLLGVHILQVSTQGTHTLKVLGTPRTREHLVSHVSLSLTHYQEIITVALVLGKKEKKTEM